MVDEIKHLEETNKIYLWGESKPNTFVVDIVMLTLYKDITGIGFKQLEVLAKNAGIPVSQRSLTHNIPLVRRALGNWAKDKMVLGTLNDWQQCPSRDGLPKRVEDSCLWMDSTDFQLTRKAHQGRKHEDWSYKCNGLGRRFMTVSDAAGKIRCSWGGYSPKLFDGTFLESHKTEIVDKFGGAVIIADNHFSRGKDIFRDVIKFHVNIKKTSDNKRKREQEDDGTVAHLTAENERFNTDHQRARARVEKTYAGLKTKFVALSKKWWEPKERLDDLVNIAVWLQNTAL